MSHVCEFVLLPHANVCEFYREYFSVILLICPSFVAVKSFCSLLTWKFALQNLNFSHVVVTLQLDI